MLKCGDRLYLFYFNIQRTNSLRLSIEKWRLIIVFFTRMTAICKQHIFCYYNVLI